MSAIGSIACITRDSDQQRLVVLNQQHAIAPRHVARRGDDELLPGNERVERNAGGWTPYRHGRAQRDAVQTPRQRAIVDISRQSAQLLRAFTPRRVPPNGRHAP